MYDGAGIAELDRSRLYAKIAMTAFLTGAVIFSYSAARVFTSGISLLTPNSTVVAFFASLALVHIALMCSIVFCVKLTNVGEHDLPIKLPPGSFDYGGMLTKKGKYVQSDGVRAEIMMNRDLRSGVLGFSPVSSTCFAVMGAMLCTCAATLGVLFARENDLRGVLYAFASPDPSLVCKLCVVTAGIALGLLVASVLRYAIFSHGSYMFVLSDSARKFPTKDVQCVTDALHISSSDVVHVRVHRVGGEPGVMMNAT